jgi:hypothetical protein
MSIDIIPINGKSQYIDYAKFESSLREKIGKRCSDAKVFLLNNFPVSVSVETNIDLILIIAIEDKKDNFYYLKSIDQKAVYFHNQIIPIKFITQFKDDQISIDDSNQIIIGESYLDFSNELNSIKFGFSRYLSTKCGFKKESLYIKPLIYIQNENDFSTENYIIAKEFDFYCLHRYFVKSHDQIFISYKEWKTENAFSFLATDIERIIDQASKDSEEGYLTRKKIERIGKQLSNARSIYDELNKNLVIISGKAGTGKSSELLLLTMKCISNGQNTLYLTYNKLLIFDIAKTVKSFVNAKLNSNLELRPGEGSVITLHQFFYRLSKSLGVLHVLNAEKIEKLLNTLKERMRLIYNFIQGKITGHETNWENLKTEIQNHNVFDIGTKEVGIDFVNYISKRSASSVERVRNLSIEFFNHKKRIVGNIEASDVFLANYYGVLEDTLLQIQNPKKFYDKHNIENKYVLLDVAIGLSKKYIEEKDGKKIITEKGFIEFKNRRVGGHRRKRTLFIDEAQDCHPLEKEILISIYNSDNIVVANGGREQLIRHVELCNWEKSQAREINVKKHYTRNKSFRVKKTVVNFCNFVAKKYQIDLNLEPLDSVDEGELLFDFRQNHSETEIKDLFNHLSLKGEVNGCSAYESLLVILESNSQRAGQKGQPEPMLDKAIINEYGNIEDAPHLRRGAWQHMAKLEKDNFMFWDGTVEDKSNLNVPSPNESRVIYYESCRGLEAWSVVCFSFDKFFSQKQDEPDAEKFLIDNEEKTKLTQDLFKVSNDDRKKMYAATWALMAMTRTIDSLYIQVNDRNSEFGKIVVEYLNQGNKNVKQLTNEVNEQK